MKLNYGDSAARLVSQRIAEVVASTTVMKAIPSNRRVHGMLCLAGTKLYRFDSAGSAGATDTHAADEGAGAWILVSQAQPASYTNGTRPAATTYAAGASIWNTDDSAPNWSDGTNWRDGAGNIT